MAHTSDVAGQLLGPALTADTGEWGTYEWNEHVLGAPGYRIAGGTDEIQRNIIGERVLGLPGRAAGRPRPAVRRARSGLPASAGNWRVTTVGHEPATEGRRERWWRRR